jgi:hypothetical protein
MIRLATCPGVGCLVVCIQHDVPSCLPLAFATGDGGNHANKSSIERMHGALKMQKIDVKLAFKKEIRILVVTESRGIRIEAANLLQPADDPVRNCGRELRANKGFKFASKRFQIMALRSW